MKKTVIRSAKVPETGGPFNLCIRHGNMVYVSGLPPFQEDFCEGLRLARSTGAPLPKYQRKSIEDEARIVMNHLKWLLEEAGSSLDYMLKVVVWLRDQQDQAAFDKVYRSYFKSNEDLPTRTRMQAGGTPFDCALEIDAIAYVPDE
ncbi:MAG: RidA family protein [Rhodospirillales bacterium]|jgi:2-iminobutanoate/2-iminopropanoate deaminase